MNYTASKGVLLSGQMSRFCLKNGPTMHPLKTEFHWGSGESKP